MPGLLIACRATAVLAAALLAACAGTPSTTPSPACRPPTPPPAPSTLAAPVAAGADRGRVDPGATVTFTVTATGPAVITISDCAAPLTLLIIDSSQLHVFSGSSRALADPALCPTATLAAGQKVTVTATWPVDSTLPGGVYTALLVLGDAPQLSLAIVVGVSPPCG